MDDEEEDEDEEDEEDDDNDDEVDDEEEYALQATSIEGLFHLDLTVVSRCGTGSAAGRNASAPKIGGVKSSSATREVLVMMMTGIVWKK